MAPGKDTDKRVKNAIDFLLKHATLSVRQAMILAKFTEEERNKPTMQMVVRRAFKKLTGQTTKEYSAAVEAAKAAALAVEVAPSVPKTIYIPTPASTNAQPLSPLLHEEVKEEEDRFQAALKMATTMYFSEKLEGSSGMSADKVVEKVKAKFDGVGPSASTIRRHVKAKEEYYENKWNSPKDSMSDYDNECGEHTPLTMEEVEEMLMEMSDHEFIYVRNRAERARAKMEKKKLDTMTATSSDLGVTAKVGEVCV
ncbi:hypothetical protein ACHAWU_009331 [Discostella pseudostelligera]|uniref:Uncharacterized protein n=1 Tax=Discostella pseudostelligera TaxID=259834 RepID=A0ABD3N3Y8_9STRA